MFHGGGAQVYLAATVRVRCRVENHLALLRQVVFDPIFVRCEVVKERVNIVRE